MKSVTIQVSDEFAAQLDTVSKILGDGPGQALEDSAGWVIKNLVEERHWAGAWSTCLDGFFCKKKADAVGVAQRLEGFLDPCEIDVYRGKAGWEISLAPANRVFIEAPETERRAA